jgi:hypothetical protein
MSLVNRCAGDLADRALFPTSADEIRTNPFRYVVSQANCYFDTVRPVAEALALGCAWGRDRHNQLWRRATEVIAGTAIEVPTGPPVQQVLMELRSYPVIPVIYSAGLGAIHRENWAALRAVSSDARIRDQTRMKVPVIAMANPWMPFASAQVAANILGFEADGTRLSDAEIEGLRTGTKPKRFTPVSDHLHGRLRSLLLPVIRNEDDYDETFDELEVIFGVITADEAARAEQRNQYLHGPWVGAFTWRQRYERPPFEQQVWARRHEAMLDVGFFGADKARANRAFETFTSEAQTARRHRL